MGLREYAAQKAQEEQQPQKKQDVNKVLLKEQEVQEDATAKALAVYKEYQENKVISSSLSAEILKGLRSGEDLGVILIKALKIISLLKDNELFYRQAAEDLKLRYGIEE